MPQPKKNKKNNSPSSLPASNINSPSASPASPTPKPEQNFDLDQTENTTTPPTPPTPNSNPYGQNYDDFRKNIEEPPTEKSQTPNSSNTLSNNDDQTPLGANYDPTQALGINRNNQAPPTFNEQFENELEQQRAESDFEDEEDELEDEFDDDMIMEEEDPEIENQNTQTAMREMAKQIAKEKIKKEIKKKLMLRIMMAVVPTCLTIFGWVTIGIIIIIIILAPILSLLDGIKSLVEWLS